MICSYCETQNSEQDTNCKLCYAPLKVHRPVFKDLITTSILKESEDLFKTLQSLHSYNLLQLLREAREERTAAYNQLRILNKVRDNEDFKEGIQMAEEEYQKWTAYTKLIQQIINDRFGYYPKKVTPKILEGIKKRAINK